MWVMSVLQMELRQTAQKENDILNQWKNRNIQLTYSSFIQADTCKHLLVLISSNAHSSTWKLGPDSIYFTK